MGGGKSKADGGGGKTVKKTYALFHGSPNAGITEFDIEKAGTNTSTGEKFLFFTDSRNMADDFSYQRLPSGSMFYDIKGQKGRVYEVDVTMKHPLDFSNLSAQDIANIKKMKHSWSNLSDRDIQLYSQYNNQLFKTSIDLTKITQFGYDGFIAKMNNKGDKEYAVVSNKQVKIRK